MEEKNQNEETKQETNPSFVQSAYEASERLKAENERMERNIKQLQELKAFEMLGGKTEGATQETKPKEETSDEYRQRIEKEMKEGKLK